MRRFSVLLIILFSASAVYALDGAVVGKIGEINNSTGEIVVNTGNSNSRVDMGEKLYLRIDGNPLMMKATFPMLTIVKCRLESGDKSRLKEIKKGMTVYKYKPGIEKKEEISTDTREDDFNRRRVLRTNLVRPLPFHNTIWKIEAPGGDPAVYYVIFKPDGKLGYSYKDAETLQVDDADSWHVEGDTLVIIWTGGYSTEKFQILPGSRIFSGKKTSKNYEGEKECTIEKVR